MQTDTVKDQDVPYIVWAIVAALVLMTPFVTFQTDFVQLPVTMLLVATGLVVWALRSYPQPRYVWPVLLTTGIVTSVTLMVTRLWYASLVSLVWLWAMVLIFILCTSWLQLRGWKKGLVLLLALSQLLLAVPGIWTFFRSWQRATGFLYNANGLGGALLWGALGGLVLILSRKQKWWHLGLWIVVLFAWLLTISLTAYLAAVAPVIVVVWWYRRTIPWKRVSLAAVGALMIVAAVWFYWRPQKLVTLMTSEHMTSSVTQRIEFDRVALAMWREKPFTGWGIGTYKQTFPRFTHQYLEQPLYAHNVYLQVLAETGIFGAVIWLGLVCVIGRLGWLAVRKSEEHDRPFYQALFAGWLAFSIHAAIDFSWHFPAGLLWWVIASATFVVKSGDSEIRSRSRILVAVFILIALGGFGVAGAELQSIRTADRGVTAKQNLADQVAIVELTSAIRLTGSPTDVDALAEVYWVRRAESDLSRGESVLQISLRRNPDNYFIQHALGMNYIAQKRVREAADAFGRAYELDPRFHPQFAINYINALRNTDRRDEAVCVLKDALQRYENEQALNPIIVSQLPALRALQAELLPVQK